MVIKMAESKKSKEKEKETATKNKTVNPNTMKQIENNVNQILKKLRTLSKKLTSRRIGVPDRDKKVIVSVLENAIVDLRMDIEHSDEEEEEEGFTLPFFSEE